MISIETLYHIFGIGAGTVSLILILVALIRKRAFNSPHMKMSEWEWNEIKSNMESWRFDLHDIKKDIEDIKTKADIKKKR